MQTPTLDLGERRRLRGPAVTETAKSLAFAAKFYDRLTVDRSFICLVKI